MKKEISLKKLVLKLNRETLRNLQSHELKDVAGGQPTRGPVGTCSECC
jgi:hypothetical protein